MKVVTVAGFNRFCGFVAPLRDVSPNALIYLISGEYRCLLAWFLPGAKSFVNLKPEHQTEMTPSTGTGAVAQTSKGSGPVQNSSGVVDPAKLQELRQQVMT